MTLPMTTNSCVPCYRGECHHGPQPHQDRPHVLSDGLVQRPAPFIVNGISMCADCVLSDDVVRSTPDLENRAYEAATA